MSNQLTFGSGNQGSSLFGGGNSSNTGTTPSLFGGSGGAPLFGSSSGNTSSLFGGGGTQTSGSTTNQPGGLFGGNSAAPSPFTTSSNTSGGGLFTTPSTAAAPPTGGLLFGSSTAPANTGSLFSSVGMPTTTPAGLGSSTSSAPPAGGAGIFGSTSATPATPSVLFGSSTTATSSTDAGKTLFSTQPTTENKPATSLFPSSNTGGGLFPSTTSTTMPSLFAGTTTTTSSTTTPPLFGSSETKPVTNQAPSTSETTTSSQSTEANPFGLWKNTSEPAKVHETLTPGQNLFTGSSIFSSQPTTSTADSSKNVSNENPSRTLFGTSSSTMTTTDQKAPGTDNSSYSFAKNELKGLTIEQIIYKWHQSLQSNVDRFQESAEKIRQRDIHLLESQKAITRLAKEGRILKESHNELRSQLDSIFELFQDLNGALEKLELNLDELEKVDDATTRASDENADQEREAAYALGKTLDSQVKKIEDEIKYVVNKLNSKESQNSGPSSSTSSILQLLNRHQASMEWIDRETGELEGSVNELLRSFQGARDSTNRL